MDTPYQHITLPANDPNGNPILSVIVKRTYDLNRDDRCTSSEIQLPLLSSDKFFNNGDPVTACCEFESDYIPYKPYADVVLNGKAHAPSNKPVPSLLCSIIFGDQKKSIQVIGDRRCTYRPVINPLWTDPEPFTEMELRYERAYGGVDIYSRKDGGALPYPRNPLGKGYIVENKKEAVEKLTLPNLEEPGNLLTPDKLILGKLDNWQSQPIPQSFNWYGKSWFPRSTFAGVLPEHTSIYNEIREASLGYVPKDMVEDFKKLKLPMMDFRFFNGAPLDLQFEKINGDEEIRLIGLDPEGDFNFWLPDEHPAVGIDIGEGPKEPETIIQTVCIKKDEDQLYIVWRAALPYPGPDKMAELKKFEIIVEE